MLGDDKSIDPDDVRDELRLESIMLKTEQGFEETRQVIGLFLGYCPSIA
jgi:hypothetical protein